MHSAGYKLILIVAAGALALTGCSVLDRTEPDHTTTVTLTSPSAEVTSSASAEPSTTTGRPGSRADQVTGAHQVNVADYQELSWSQGSPMVHDNGYAFKTPSGNIGCYWTTEVDRLVCNLGTRDTPPAPRPASCAPDAGPGWSTDHVVLTSVGAEDGICTGGVQVPNQANVLPYGSALTAADFACLSEESGVTCVHRSSGRGFFVSRKRFDTF